MYITDAVKAGLSAPDLSCSNYRYNSLSQVIDITNNFKWRYFVY